MTETLELRTQSLTLVLSSPEEARREIAAMPPEHRAQVSADWIERVTSATAANPWVHGFTMIETATQTRVGSGAFKGPPDDNGAVEVAYAVEPDHQGQGFATEATDALAEYALGRPGVGLVCAHTLPEPNASTRVLTKCGFRCVGEVTDPEDGRVWRWERTRKPA